MTMAAQMQKEPRWAATAEKIDKVEPGMLNMAEVADLTGLRATTLQIAINSEAANTGRRARLRTLAAPKYNWHGIPIWDVKQVSAYHATVSERWKTQEEFAGLPVLTEEQVIEQQLTSLRGAARRTTIPLTTLHRWKLMESFPAPKALMRVNSPTPRVLYSWEKLKECVIEHHADWLEDHPTVNLATVTIEDTND